MLIKYEKLLKIYFKCCKIVHDDIGCVSGYRGRKKSSGKENQYGSWLRVENGVQHKGGRAENS